MVFFLGSWAIFRTDGFDLAHLALVAETEENLSLYPLEKIQEILAQPYNYLGKGRQAFVFLSLDGCYVLKVFNRTYIDIPPWTALLPLSWQTAEKLKRTERREFYHTSYPLAFEYLNEGDNLLYIHRNSTPYFSPLQITTWGPSSLPLNSLTFILQKRGTPLASLALPIEEIIDNYLQFIARRIECGLIDCDRDVENNFGFLDTLPPRDLSREPKSANVCNLTPVLKHERYIPFLLDPGRLRRDPALTTLAGLRKEWSSSVRHLRHWVETHHKEALPLLEAQSNHTFQALRARKEINVSFGLTRKIPRLHDHKWGCIDEYYPIYDRATSGLWRSPKGTFIPLRALRARKGL